MEMFILLTLLGLSFVAGFCSGFGTGKQAAFEQVIREQRDELRRRAEGTANPKEGT